MLESVLLIFTILKNFIIMLDFLNQKNNFKIAFDIEIMKMINSNIYHAYQFKIHNVKNKNDKNTFMKTNILFIIIFIFIYFTFNYNTYNNN